MNGLIEALESTATLYFLKEEIPLEEHERRIIDDLDVRRFIEYFFTPYSPEDSLDYMSRELITFKKGEALEFCKKTFEELVSKPKLAEDVGRVVEVLYRLKFRYERMSSDLERDLSHLSHKGIRWVGKKYYEILKNYTESVSLGTKLDASQGLVKEFRDFAIDVSNKGCYRLAESLLYQMENFGKAKLVVEYDWFDEVKKVVEIVSEERRSMEDLKKWYLRAKGEATNILNLRIFPSRGESFFVESLGRLTKENERYIQGMLGYRKKLDFFLGAVRYVRKIQEEGTSLAYPNFDREKGFLIKELYNPCLFLQSLKKENIICNDAEVKDEKVNVLTGANNTGKSVYVKSIGLAYALAQNGFPIPAKEAHLSQLDGVLTHFMHPEDIEKGEGAFLDELRRMKEILSKATENTLIIVDEPVRGSSPEDAEEMGYRFIKGFVELGAPTFITTHLHSLAKRVEGLNGVRNLRTEIRIEKGKLIPTYKVKPGVAGKSYGVEIADQFGMTEEGILKLVKKDKNLNCKRP